MTCKNCKELEDKVNWLFKTIKQSRLPSGFKHGFFPPKKSDYEMVTLDEFYKESKQDNTGK